MSGLGRSLTRASRRGLLGQRPFFPTLGRVFAGLGGRHHSIGGSLGSGGFRYSSPSSVSIFENTRVMPDRREQETFLFVRRPELRLPLMAPPTSVFEGRRTTSYHEVSVTVLGHFWPNAVLPATPRFDHASIERTLVGTEVEYTIDPPPAYPCDPVPPSTNCGTVRPSRPVQVTRRIASQDLGVSLHPYVASRSIPAVLEVRLLYVVSLRFLGGTSRANSSSWPKLFDAITAEALLSAVSGACSPDLSAAMCSN